MEQRDKIEAMFYYNIFYQEVGIVLQEWISIVRPFIALYYNYIGMCKYKIVLT